MAGDTIEIKKGGRSTYAYASVDKDELTDDPSLADISTFDYGTVLRPGAHFAFHGPPKACRLRCA